jgi:hypothetical protein
VLLVACQDSSAGFLESSRFQISDGGHSKEFIECVKQGTTPCACELTKLQDGGWVTQMLENELLRFADNAPTIEMLLRV